MKKTKLLLLLPALLLVGCSKSSGSKSTFKELKDDETLFVGENNRFKNNVTVDEGNVYAEYVAYITYTLSRTTYQYGDNDVLYEGYYYHWNANQTQDSSLLGVRKITTTTTYEYMPYTEDEFVVVRTKTVTQSEYTYQSGLKTFDRTVEYVLNGYFTNIEALRTSSEALYNKIDHSTSSKQYIVATPRTITQTQTQNYNTYYFIEEDK